MDKNFPVRVVRSASLSGVKKREPQGDAGALSHFLVSNGIPRLSAPLFGVKIWRWDFVCHLVRPAVQLRAVKGYDEPDDSAGSVWGRAAGSTIER